VLHLVESKDQVMSTITVIPILVQDNPLIITAMPQAHHLQRRQQLPPTAQHLSLNQSFK
jgi:hypothetical protein